MQQQVKKMMLKKEADNIMERMAELRASVVEYKQKEQHERHLAESALKKLGSSRETAVVKAREAADTAAESHDGFMDGWAKRASGLRIRFGSLLRKRRPSHHAQSVSIVAEDPPPALLSALSVVSAAPPPPLTASPSQIAPDDAIAEKHVLLSQ